MSGFLVEVSGEVETLLYLVRVRAKCCLFEDQGGYFDDCFRTDGYSKFKSSNNWSSSCCQQQDFLI